MIVVIVRDEKRVGVFGRLTVGRETLDEVAPLVADREGGMIDREGFIFLSAPGSMTPRATTVEPRQGLVKDLFERATCWMRGDESQRWLFAARGVAVQIAQRRAYRRGTSTRNIKEEVIGV